MIINGSNSRFKEQDTKVEMEDIIVNDQQKEDLPSYMEISKDYEMTPGEAGTKDHEL